MRSASGFWPFRRASITAAIDTGTAGAKAKGGSESTRQAASIRIVACLRTLHIDCCLLVPGSRKGFQPLAVPTAASGYHFLIEPVLLLPDCLKGLEGQLAGFYGGFPVERAGG